MNITGCSSQRAFFPSQTTHIFLQNSEMNSIFSIQSLNEVAHFHQAKRDNSPGVHGKSYIYIFAFNNMISGHSKGPLLMQ